MTPSPPRTSFFDEQARRRAQARGWGWVTTAVGLLLGWMFGFLVLTAVFFYAKLLSVILPERIEAAFDAATPNADVVALPLVIGGLVVAIALWAIVRAIFARDVTAGTLAHTHARGPNRADPEEVQLVNVAEEMAIAAAIPAPRVWLFDGEAINAAALGHDASDAALLVSRRLLDTLDRDETQGVLGHLVATVVNGDLRLMAAMLHLFYTLGLAVTLLDAPFSGRARRALGALIRHLVRSRSTASSPDTADAIGAGLTASLQPEGLNCVNTFMQRLLETKVAGEFGKVIGALILMPLLPLIMMRLAAAIAYGLLSLFVLGPLVALVLRTRRRLADATAVQLTRHPDGLACALVHLAGLAHAVPGVGWAEMLFIVGPEAVNARRLDRLQERMAEVRAAATDTTEKFQGAREAVAELQAHTPEETEAVRHNFIFGFHPSLNSRIRQLKCMGATKVDWTDRRDYSAWILAAVVTVVGGCVVLLAVAGSK